MLVFAAGERALDFEPDCLEWELGVQTWAHKARQIIFIFWASIFPPVKWEA